MNIRDLLSVRIAWYVLLWIPGFAYGQNRCAGDRYSFIQEQQGVVRESKEQFENWIASQVATSRPGPARRGMVDTYRIPVVVHVIHNGEPVGTGSNISDEQIHSQIAVINDDFNRLNKDASETPPEFRSLAGAMNISFVLATQAADGTTSDGINRVKGTRASWTIEQHAEVKALSYWPAENYLNIWVCNISGDYFGFTQFPVSTLPGVENSSKNRLTDGIMISYEVFGSVEAGDFDLLERFDKGRGLTHELGHFLGLRHPWGDAEGCGGTDYVSDTPAQSSATYGCPAHPYPDCSATTLPNRMFQNYLDFTDDACMNLFTAGQVARMKIVLENSPRRASLLIPLSPERDVPAFEKIFSPNGDGINDYWRWENTLAYEGCKLLVFNRFGKLVYSMESYDNSWDGRASDGSMLEEEAYYFIIRCDGRKDVTGGVRIVR